MFDLISIGDTVIDTFVPLDDASVNTQAKLPLLCLPLGLKVPMGDPVSLIGGNAANATVAASRLGLKTAIYTNIGKKEIDVADERIMLNFKKEKVDTRYVIHNSDFSTSHNILLEFKGERTILTHHHEWRYQLPDLDQTKWVYLTSLAPNFILTNIVEQILIYLERTAAKLFFQPGTFQIKAGVKKNTKLLSISQVLILNLEEAEKLLGKESEGKVKVKSLLKELFNLGPKNVVITNGVDGSYGFDGENYFKLEIFPANLLQKTGAGDAYASATLAGLFYGNSLPEAMRWGAANAASVIEQIGPQAGLLTYNQMKEKLKENKKIIAKEI